MHGYYMHGFRQRTLAIGRHMTLHVQYRYIARQLALGKEHYR